MNGTPAGGFKDETALNKWLRTRIRLRGMMCVHVREADFPGVPDLVVWQEGRMVAWLELKLDDREVEAGQKEFMRCQSAGGTRNYVLRYRTDVEIFYLEKYTEASTFYTVFSDQDIAKVLEYAFRT